MKHISMFKVLWANPPAKFFLILSVISIICFSCNKSSLIGLDVQPENDLINALYQDTLTLVTQTIKEDSLRTDANAIFTIGLIGKYIDPLFGEATSSIYTQLLMGSNAPSFGQNPLCDSVVLSLAYLDSYGKKIRQKQTINVYQLTEDLDVTKSYFSHEDKLNNGIDLANSYVFLPRPKDSIMVLGNKVAPGLRIPLQTNFGQAILDKQNASELATNANFIAWIKGLFITTKNTPGLVAPNGNILMFNFAYSVLNIYYRNDNDDSLRYDIYMDGARYMRFAHDYTTANLDVQKQVASTNPSLQNDVVYVQSMSGLKTRIKIPNLVTWGKKDLVAINRAELVVKCISSRKDTFAIVPALNLFAIRDDGVSPEILDDALEGSAYFGGTLDTTDNCYHFNITRHIQQIISERKKNNGFFITSASGASSATRVAIGGGTPTINGGTIPNNYQMKLNITYTKLK